MTPCVSPNRGKTLGNNRQNQWRIYLMTANVKMAQALFPSRLLHSTLRYSMDTYHSLGSQCGCHTGFNLLASRRSFLGAMGAIGTVGALASSGCTSMGGPAKPHRIDVHHHISPPEWVPALKKSKLDSPPVSHWTPQRSLDDIDKAGIATSMTSPTLPAVGFLPPAQAAAVARASNECAR